MALLPFQRRRIAWLIDSHLEEDFESPEYLARWNRHFSALSTPEELFLFASESHPAMQPAEWLALLDHPLCDQGTALLIFWRNSPEYFYGDEPVGGWEREPYDLVRQIERRYSAGGYPFAVVKFDPDAFKGFGFLTKCSRLDKVPAAMCRPSAGEPAAELAKADFEWSDDGF